MLTVKDNEISPPKSIGIQEERNENIFSLLLKNVVDNELH